MLINRNRLDLGVHDNEDKKGILDVRVKTQDGRQINIEIQILPTEFMPERTLFYWSKMFTSQIHSGEGYELLKKCITINIVDFDCTPLKQVHSCYHLVHGMSLTTSIAGVTKNGL
jgi:predicted transposase/invertase (TIGR01784 family)